MNHGVQKVELESHWLLADRVQGVPNQEMRRSDVDALNMAKFAKTFWAAKFPKNKNDQRNHAGGFSMSLCAGLSLKMQPRNN